MNPITLQLPAYVATRDPDEEQSLARKVAEARAWMTARKCKDLSKPIEKPHLIALNLQRREASE